MLLVSKVRPPLWFNLSDELFAPKKPDLLQEAPRLPSGVAVFEDDQLRR